MPRSNDEKPRSCFEQRVAGASTAQALRYRAAYEELVLINRELTAEAARLAELVEARLTRRWTA